MSALAARSTHACSAASSYSARVSLTLAMWYEYSGCPQHAEYTTCKPVPSGVINCAGKSGQYLCDQHGINPCRFQYRPFPCDARVPRDIIGDQNRLKPLAANARGTVRGYRSSCRYLPSDKNEMASPTGNAGFKGTCETLPVNQRRYARAQLHPTPTPTPAQAPAAATYPPAGP